MIVGGQLAGSHLPLFSNQDFDALFADNSLYLGCWPKDLLKGIKIPPKTYSFAIINMQDNDDGDGSHWVAAFNNPVSNYIYYFDSYGIVPPTAIIEWMKQTKKAILYNTTQIQAFESTACGLYVLYFIQSMLASMRYYDFILKFQDGDGEDNEKILLSHIAI